MDLVDSLGADLHLPVFGQVRHWVLQILLGFQRAVHSKALLFMKDL
jgi:hypothetical protein